MKFGRKVSLMDRGLKIYTDILNEKFDEEIFQNTIYSESLFKNREGRGTTDAIFW